MTEAILDAATQFVWLVGCFALARGLQALGELATRHHRTRTRTRHPHKQ